MKYDEWAKTVTPFHAAMGMFGRFGYTVCWGWRNGYPFVGVTLHTPWRSFRPIHVDRRPARSDGTIR